ncbi:MAG: TolC family protein [Bacteroidota bacterium]
MKKTLLFLFGLLWAFSSLQAQDSLSFAFVSDAGDDANDFFEQSIRSEIEGLLGNSYQIVFEVYEAVGNSPTEIKSAIDQAYRSDVDIVVGLGVNSCLLMGRQANLSKPTILSIILDAELQQIPITPEGTSGIGNLSYIQSPFNIGRDLQALYEIIPYKKLGILNEESLNQTEFNTFFSLKNAFSKAPFESISVTAEVGSTLDKIGDDIDAIYILPIFNALDSMEMESLLGAIAERGIPTMSLLSSPMIELGAFAAYETDGNLERIPRRIALNALKIVEGEDAGNLPVSMPNFTENLLFNMKAVKATGVYPSWDIMAKGVLLNVVTPDDNDRQISLQSTISEALQNNLSIKIADKDVRIAEKEVAIAKSNLLPQVNTSATALVLDENTVRTSFGTRGYFNLSASATLDQLVLSEPALANIAIQKLLLASEEQALRQSELDVVLDMANAYLGTLQSLALVELRNDNVQVTRKNYDIAQAKEEVGYGGTSDVFRWQSELALDNVDLNTARAQYRQACFNINALLNRPIKESFQIADLELADSILLVMDSRLFPLIDNPGDLELFADFLVDEAFKSLPEIQQISFGKAAQERSLLSQKRAFYLPSIGFSGQYDYPIENSGFPEGVMPIDIKPTYNLALGLQIPIFQGNSRRRTQEQTQVGIFQLNDQLQDLQNNLELRVRANLEIAAASFSNLALSREAAEAAEKNFEIAQNSYQQGLLNVTSLIDAQNAVLGARINATNAAYTFMSDFLEVERASGYYHFLALPQEQAAFFSRFIAFIAQNRND